MKAFNLSELILDESFPAVLSDHVYEKGDRSFAVQSPIDASMLGTFSVASEAQLQQAIAQAKQAFQQWRQVPAPRRGDLVRELGNEFRQQKESLAHLISRECGKIYQEALGEVQEVIDICDFAVGVSRQLHGLTIASERPQHRMMEQWHPLGVVGIITAFNFPMAVWAWNAALALICGDTLIWKPSEKTPACALACQHLFNRVMRRHPDLPSHLSTVVVGEVNIGEAITNSVDIALVSATGSVAMGRRVAQLVAQRLGKCLLELGGNNGLIVTPSANMQLAANAVLFSAVGTCGQRCTSLRRLFVQESVKQDFLKRLIKAYQQIVIGDPLDEKTLVGPLIDRQALRAMQEALSQAVREGGRILYGGEQISAAVPAGGIYVRPAIVDVPADAQVIQQETFAPILYVISYVELADAIELHNSVPQGLSSAIFTNQMQEAELFMSAQGSDCGITNVNIGTSGAEIGGAFGGEKDTGGGRESGSDAWKNYMRRATNTINYGNALPLSQGIEFNLS